MSANVRCAGHTRMHNGSLLIVQSACGWEGERFGIGWFPPQEGETPEQAHQRYRTAKPCPRCGGRVELSPRGDPVTGRCQECGRTATCFIRDPVTGQVDEYCSTCVSADLAEVERKDDDE